MYACMRYHFSGYRQFLNMRIQRLTLTHFALESIDVLGSSPARSCPSDGVFFFPNKYCHSFVRICSFTCLNVVIVILWDTKGKAPASYQCLCALELLGIVARMWTTFKSLDCVHLKCESEMSLSVNCSFN